MNVARTFRVVSINLLLSFFIPNFLEFYFIQKGSYSSQLLDLLFGPLPQSLRKQGGKIDIQDAADDKEGHDRNPMADAEVNEDMAGGDRCSPGGVELQCPAL